MPVYVQSEFVYNTHNICTVLKWMLGRTLVQMSGTSQSNLSCELLNITVKLNSPMRYFDSALFGFIVCVT